MRRDAGVDLAYLCFDHNAYGLLLGNGDGTFVDAPGSPWNFTNPQGFCSADFDGDGIGDLMTDSVWYFDGGIYDLLDTDGGFRSIDLGGPASYSIDFGCVDLNGDQKPDLAVVGGYYDDALRVAFGNGDGTFSDFAVYDGGDGFYKLVTADFDGQGGPDLAMAGARSVAVFLNDGDGGFSPAGGFAVDTPVAIVAADFDGQNGPDIAVLSRSETTFPGVISIWLNDGTGHFVEQAIVLKVLGFQQGEPAQLDLLAAADFDGDGHADLAMALFEVGALVFRSNGDGTFQAPVVLDAGAGAYSVTAFDLDGNGTPDLAVATMDGIWVYLNAR